MKSISLIKNLGQPFRPTCFPSHQQGQVLKNYAVYNIILPQYAHVDRQSSILKLQPIHIDRTAPQFPTPRHAFALGKNVKNPTLAVSIGAGVSDLSRSVLACCGFCLTQTLKAAVLTL